MQLPKENVGSLPRPARLQAAIQGYDAGKVTRHSALEPNAAYLDSITRAATGTPTVSDGEQRTASFATAALLWVVNDSGLGAGIGAAKRSHRKSHMQ